MKPSIFNQPKAAPGIKRQDRLSQMARQAPPEPAPEPEPPAAKKAGRLESMATFEPEPHRAVLGTRGPDQLQRMAVFGPEPEVLVAPAKPVEPEPIPKPEPVCEPINKLASMALSESALVPSPVVPAPRAWDFEFERNPNGTIRRIRALQVPDAGVHSSNQEDT